MHREEKEMAKRDASSNMGKDGAEDDNGDGEKKIHNKPQQEDLLQREHMRIRPYVDTDNAAMQAMEKACVQGDPSNFTWYAVFDDFSDRAKKYELHSILVMERASSTGDDDSSHHAIGTASVGMKRINWLDEQKNPTVSWVGHAFNLRLDPNYRGRGLSAPLSAERKRVARESGCTHLYGTIAPTNIPSLRAFRPCETLYMDYFSSVLPELCESMNDVSPNEQSDNIVCTQLNNEEALKWITQAHGTQLFFPADIRDILQHKHCLGVYRASTTTNQQSDQTSSSSTFALWDSSASFRWQLTQNGVQLPLQRIAVVFGLELVGPLGFECLEYLFRYLRPRVLAKHQRLSCPLARNALSEQLKAATNGTLQPAADIALVISPTIIGDEKNDTRFNNVTSDMIFCDPRDY